MCTKVYIQPFQLAELTGLCLKMQDVFPNRNICKPLRIPSAAERDMQDVTPEMNE